MDVLNTTGGGYDLGATFFAILAVCIAIYAGWCAAESIKDRMYGFSLIFSILSVIALAGALLMASLQKPIRHEVTLRPGHVIDATKYEIVEQRGKIYVIEEREAGE